MPLRLLLIRYLTTSTSTEVGTIIVVRIGTGNFKNFWLGQEPLCRESCSYNSILHLVVDL